jgi:hypothetical protein
MVRGDKVRGRIIEVVIATLQLFQILVANEALLPQVLEQVEVWPRCF